MSILVSYFITNAKFFSKKSDHETNELIDETSNVLRETKIPLSRHKKCKSEWKKDDVENIICAGTHGIGAGEVPFHLFRFIV